MKPFALHIDQRIRINLYSLFLFQILGKPSLIALFNSIIFPAEFRVVSHRHDLFKQTVVTEQVSPDIILNQITQFRICQSKPSSVCNAVGNCKEFLRINIV